MNGPSLMVCKGLLQRLDPRIQGELLTYLPPKAQSVMNSLPYITPLSNQLLGWNLIDRIDPTWIAPYLRTLSKGEIGMMLGALEKELTASVANLLGFSNGISMLTPLGKEALQVEILKALTQEEELTPPAFLPDHPLVKLLLLHRTERKNLLLYLGLHDLAFEMKQIIDTKKLKILFKNLTKKQGEYLNSLLLHTEPISFERLFLNKWDGSKKSLEAILNERGAQRLSNALDGASSSLVWYLTRLFPMHQGNLILKFSSSHPHKRSLQILQKQVNKVIAFLTPKEAA